MKPAGNSPRSVTVLGATGSIGDSTMDLLRQARDRYQVEALTAHSNVEALARLASAVVTLLELRRTTAQLAMALENVRTLGELIPICSSCHKVRDDQDYWSSLERFVSSRTGSRFTHGLCPGCLTDLYPEIAESVMARVRAKHEQGGGEPTT